MYQEQGPRKTPSPTGSTVTYSSWTSSVHTVETQNPDSIMTNRANTPRKAPSINSRITQLGDFYQLEPTRIVEPSSQPTIIHHERDEVGPSGNAASIRNQSRDSAKTQSGESLQSQSTIRRAGPYEAHRAATPPLIQQPQRQRALSIESQNPAPHGSSEGTLVGTPILTGEQFWPTENRSHGHRVEPKLERGVLSRAGPDGQQHWRQIIELIIQYTFTNPDLLEEALESPGSGVNCVGASHRHFHNGNEELAKVGARVMELVVRDQCYTFKVPEGDDKKILDRLLGRQNLFSLGRESKIEQFIRPRLPLPHSKKSNLFSLMKEDLQFEDPWRTIARGIRAIIGGVYYDGGLDAARRTMDNLSLCIRAK